MTQPTQNQVHVDKVLTQISIAYMNELASFVATEVFPVISVDKQSDKYWEYTQADWFRDEAALRADATESEGSGYGVTTSTYFCDVYGFHKDIGNQTRQNADAPLNVDADAARFVTHTLMLRQEIQWVTDYFASSIWGTDSTPSNLWSNYGTSDPIDNVETGKATILTNTGRFPNTMVLGYNVYRQLRNHPDIIDRIKFTSFQTVTEDLLARVFDVDRVLVAKAIKNTANEGASASYSLTHGKHALLAHVADTPGLLTPSAGYTFMWKGVSQGMGTNVAVSRMDMPLKKATRVEAEIAWDNKVIATNLGYFFASAVA